MSRSTATPVPVDSAPGKAEPPARRPRGPRWERRKESRPSELLEAALEIFVERGYAAARLEDVAAFFGSESPPSPVAMEYGHG